MIGNINLLICPTFHGDHIFFLFKWRSRTASDHQLGNTFQVAPNSWHGPWRKWPTHLQNMANFLPWMLGVLSSRERQATQRPLARRVFLTKSREGSVVKTSTGKQSLDRRLTVDSCDSCGWLGLSHVTFDQA